MFLNGEKVERVLSQKDFKPEMGVRMEVIVQNVYDGDTFTGIYKNTKIGAFVQDKFRLARIDAAEIKKPRGISETKQQKEDRINKATNARETLTRMILGSTVLVNTIKIDPYNRIICEVEAKIEGGGNLNISSALLDQHIVDPYLGG